jgi:hypothetical protein
MTSCQTQGRSEANPRHLSGPAAGVARQIAARAYAGPVPGSQADATDCATGRGYVTSRLAAAQGARRCPDLSSGGWAMLSETPRRLWTSSKPADRTGSAATHTSGASSEEIPHLDRSCARSFGEGRDPSTCRFASLRTAHTPVKRPDRSPDRMWCPAATSSCRVPPQVPQSARVRPRIVRPSV